MTNNRTIINALIVAIIMAIVGFTVFANNLIELEAKQLAATLFAASAALLTIASFIEVQRQTVASTNDR